MLVMMSRMENKRKELEKRSRIRQIKRKKLVTTPTIMRQKTVMKPTNMLELYSYNN